MVHVSQIWDFFLYPVSNLCTHFIFAQTLCAHLGSLHKFSTCEALAAWNNVTFGDSRNRKF